MVAAPAGSGKTTLISDWVSGLDRPAAWLSLDEADNDAVRWSAHLVSAVRSVAAEKGLRVIEPAATEGGAATDAEVEP